MSSGNRAGLVLILVLLFLAASGCGGNTGEAKQYIKEAEDLYNKAQQTTGELIEKKKEIFEVLLSNDEARLKSMEDSVVGVLSEAYHASITLAEAATGFKKVEELKGVDDYKEYSSIMLEAISAEKEALAMARRLADDLLGVIKELEQGKTYDLTSLITSTSSTLNLLDKYANEVEENEREARIFARENNLF